jgi:hypothetical protein
VIFTKLLECTKIEGLQMSGVIIDFAMRRNNQISNFSTSFVGNCLAQDATLNF